MDGRLKESAMIDVRERERECRKMIFCIAIVWNKTRQNAKQGKQIKGRNIRTLYLNDPL